METIWSKASEKHHWRKDDFTGGQPVMNSILQMLGREKSRSMKILSQAKQKECMRLL